MALDPKSNTLDAEPQRPTIDGEGLLPGGFHRWAPVTDVEDTVETNLRRPLTDAVITVRIIKSFEYRSMKALVLSGIDLTNTTVGELVETCRKEVATKAQFKAFRSYASQLDTLKLYTRAHGSKTTNLIINLDHEDWLLSDPDKKLVDVGVENETELSLFNGVAYTEFLANPQTRWDESG